MDIGGLKGKKGFGKGGSAASKERKENLEKVKESVST